MPDDENDDTSILTRRPGSLGRREFLAGFAAAAALLPAGPVLAARKPVRPYPDMVGRIRRHVTRASDTLIDLAVRYGVGYTELLAANQGVDPWLPGAGVELIIPDLHILPLANPEGLVINLADQRLYLFRPETGTVDTAPIGIGAVGWVTPTGRTKVVGKRVNPTWYVPKSIRAEQPELPAAVPPGPDNPLGKFAIDLGWPSYLIHGTNKPAGVGRRVSHGCIRLYPEDIVRLFEYAPIGLPVSVVDQQVKLAHVAGVLMLEVHPNARQSDQLEAKGVFETATPPEFEYLVLDAAGGLADRIDWATVRKAARERTGVPVNILRPKRTAASESRRRRPRR